MKKAVFIEATRDGYGPEQCRTRTIREFIELLEEMAAEMGDECEVFLRHDRGYTYGGVWSDIEAGCYDSHGVYDEYSEEFEDEMGWRS